MDIFKSSYTQDSDKILIIQQKHLRAVIGILGMLLPLLLYFFLWIDTNYYKPLETISHYYFTRVCGIFVIVVSMLAVFLIIYKGKAMLDFLLSTIAGIAALLLLLFPTGNIPRNSEGFVTSVTMLKHTTAFRENFHYSCAGVFLISLSLISLFIFTLSDKPKQLRTKQKNARNFI